MFYNKCFLQDLELNCQEVMLKKVVKLTLHCFITSLSLIKSLESVIV